MHSVAVWNWLRRDVPTPGSALASNVLVTSETGLAGKTPQISSSCALLLSRLNSATSCLWSLSISAITYALSKSSPESFSNLAFVASCFELAAAGVLRASGRRVALIDHSLCYGHLPFSARNPSLPGLNLFQRPTFPTQLPPGRHQRLSS